MNNMTAKYKMEGSVSAVNGGKHAW